MLLAPAPPEQAERIEIIRGPNIKRPPIPPPLPERFAGRVLIVLGDNISTGSMAPDGAIVMADRSNVAAIAEYTFMKEDPGFVRRAKDWGAASSSAARTTARGPAASTPPWPRSPWGCAASWPRASPASTGAT